MSEYVLEIAAGAVVGAAIGLLLAVVVTVLWWGRDGKGGPE